MTTPTQNTATPQPPLRQRLGRSTLVHGLIGASMATLLLMGNMFNGLTFYEMRILSAFENDLLRKPIDASWLTNGFAGSILCICPGLIPACMGLIVYFLRQLMIGEKPIVNGGMVYVMVGLLSPFACFLFIVGLVYLAGEGHWITIRSAGVWIYGFIAGVLCIQIEKRLNKAS